MSPPLYLAERERPFWGFAEVLIVAALFLPAVWIGTRVVDAGSSYLHSNPELGLPLLIAEFIGYAIVFLALWLLFARHGKPLFESLAWVEQPFRPLHLAVLGIALAAACVILGNLLNIPNTETPFDKLLSDPASRIGIAIFGVTLGPVIEELLFRGFLQPVLVDSFGVLPGIVVTSVLFGALHLTQNAFIWQSGVLITIVGFVLGVVRHVSGSTRASAITHISYNALPFLTLILSGGPHSETMIETIKWSPDGVVMIDQTRLPSEEIYVTCRTYIEVADAIRTMIIRGAPAIGVAAAMGVALGFAQGADFETICTELASTRPTAVNLFWAIDRMRRLYASVSHLPPGQIRDCLITEAKLVREEDIEINRAIGRHGAPLVPDGHTVLTHCNAGALATAGYGTALGVIRAAVEAGKSIDVFADETRPFLQGARLTAWELQRDGIRATVITDNMAGHFLHAGRIGCVIVGADRIAANGDVANKIGTYGVAVLAKENNIPFYVAAPISTLDLTLPDGSQIPIEERSAAEVTHVQGVRMAPEGIEVRNPAFDVTPNRYVTAIITEKGVARAPYNESLRGL